MAIPAPDLPATEILLSDRRTDATLTREAPSAATDPQQRERWLAATSQGDTGAFALLYDDVAPNIHGLVLRILRDVREAEALTQRVFLEIWRSSARFDSGHGAALSWMTTLAHRMCVEHVRGNPDRRTPTRSAPDTALLRGALADLEPTERHALKLAYFNAHSHDEVGQILRLPSGSAKACLTRGLHGLSRNLSAATS